MKIDVLLSTMNKENHEIIKKSGIKKGVVINQIGKDNIQNIKSDSFSVKWIDSDSSGLSKSRNLALQHSNADYCIIADDDIIYEDNYDDTISKAINQNPDIDIFAFKVEGINGFFKKYGKREKRIGFLGSLKLASVQIVVKRKSIVDKQLQFREEFGSGSTYKMGEENIFLFDCLRNGLKIKYIPHKIANVYIGDSTWFEGYNKKYFFDLGAIYYTLSNKLFYLLSIQFLIRKRKLYRNDIRFVEAFRSMLHGKSDIKNKRIV